MKRWLEIAEVIDSLRIFPRLLIFSYLGCCAYAINYVLVWYTHIPAAQQTVQNAGLMTALAAVLTGFGVPIFSTYSQNGRDWNAKPAP